MGDGFDTRKIRNICILAHVDHGKTTLADHLIAASGGGVLHPKLAGRVRFMDYLDEEQRRAITMKSSSISLQYKDYSINLIDSPGHMDFCSEVSTAARLSDGALILVDAVEGVHIQTHAVLRQCWIEKLSPCLVLNKIDRLISELKLSPMEAYTRLLRIVHEVNGIVSAYKSEKYLSDVDFILAGPSGDAIGDENSDLLEDDDEDMFQPQKGNVAFVCALDGWGFGIHEFAEFYASKLGASAAALQKALWGPRYFNSKTKMIVVGKKGIGAGSKARPMFVQFVLEPLWQVYQGALEADGEKGMLEKVIKSFNLSVPSRELQNKDPKVVLQAVMSRWLPLSDTILSMVVKCMPDPVSAQSFRISRLLPNREVLDDRADKNVLVEAELVRKSVEVCDLRPEAPCVAFVSKMFTVPVKLLPHRGSHGEIINYSGDEGEGESEECFLAFARIFSGVLSAGQRVFVLSALYDPLKGEQMQKHVQEAELQSLYLMMGQGLKAVTSAKAGNIVAIRGLGQHILKSATLSSSKNCWPFSSMAFQVAPTLRVAIEPSDPADMGALLKGLRLLNRADPFVEVTVSARGEHVLAAAGEVHLERCVKDLKERFAKVRLEVSPPLVSYKETIEGEVSNMLENLKALIKSSDYVEKTTPNGRCVVRVHVMKLPSSLTKVLDDSSDVLGDAIGVKSGQTFKSLDTKRSSILENDNPTEVLKKRIMDAVESEISSKNENDKDYADKCKAKWLKLLRRIWALGPRQIGPNILFTPDVKVESSDSSVLIRGRPYVSERLGFADDLVAETSSNVNEALHMEAERLESNVISGFELATAAGPLCDEPMWGLAFVIEAYISSSMWQHDESESHQHSEQYGIFAGQVIATVKDACRAAVLQNKPRLVEAMYFCELNTPTEYLGPMYAVLSRRRARILKEEMQEGSPFFTVHAYVPVSESFGFSDELRRWTSGAASALLVLSHWEALSEDPFFVPKTVEEIEEFGDGSSVLPNTARKLINAVRRRKGLPVEEKVVQHGTKQRTLARKSGSSARLDPDLERYLVPAPLTSPNSTIYAANIAETPSSLIDGSGSRTCSIRDSDVSIDRPATLKEREIIIPDPSKVCQSSGMVEFKSLGTCTAQQKQDGQKGHLIDRGVGSPRLVKSGLSTSTTVLNLDTDTKNSMPAAAGAVAAAAVADQMLGPKEDRHLAINWVGLPTQGKTFTAAKLTRYLHWLGHDTKHFNIGKYCRLKLGTNNQSADFFRADNPEGMEPRNEVAALAFEEMISWMQGGQVAHSWTFRYYYFPVLFISFNLNLGWDTWLKEDARPDFEAGLQDFKNRLANYEKVYEPVEEGSYIKMIDMVSGHGGQIQVNNISGYLPGRIVFFLVNTHLTPRPILFSRHGESQDNVRGRIGGDAAISETGQLYAKKLANFVEKRLKSEQAASIWTSTLQRTILTASPIVGFPKIQWRALDEINAGGCDGMTYEEIKKNMPEEYDSRTKDKLRYRYPRGESYLDVIQRLEPVIIELERQRAPVVVISHQAVLRALYAYFADRPLKETPHIEMPLHTIIEIQMGVSSGQGKRYKLMD